MTTTTAKLRHLRIAPRKVRVVADLIRGKDAGTALDVLQFTVKKAAEPMRKLLYSAVSNAVENHAMDADALYVQSIHVDQGPTRKRWRPRAMGRATKIQKKTSHITLTLGVR